MARIHRFFLEEEWLTVHPGGYIAFFVEEVLLDVLVVLVRGGCVHGDALAKEEP